jgi:hypothetical protein
MRNQTLRPLKRDAEGRRATGDFAALPVYRRTRPVVYFLLHANRRTSDLERSLVDLPHVKLGDI